MKKMLLGSVGFALLGLCSFMGLTDEGGYRRITNNKFSQGEKLTYRVHYGFVNAGEATVVLDKNLYTINNRVCYKVDIQGRTTGIVRWTYSVDDLWQSYIDTAAIIPHKFHRNIHENDYRKLETVTFDHLKGSATVKDRTGDEPEKSRNLKIPRNVQDIVSGYYYLRTLDFDQLRAKDTLVINGMFEDKVYDMRVVYLGKDAVRTKFGKINAAIVSPVLPENSLFDGTDAIKMWVSDDANRVPVKIKVAMAVGAVEMDIVGQENLRYPFNTKQNK
jgi:hypothetical protein